MKMRTELSSSYVNFPYPTPCQSLVCISLACLRVYVCSCRYVSVPNIVLACIILSYWLMMKLWILVVGQIPDRTPTFPFKRKNYRCSSLEKHSIPSISPMKIGNVKIRTARHICFVAIIYPLFGILTPAKIIDNVVEIRIWLFIFSPCPSQIW